jgi:hypothetical protein
MDYKWLGRQEQQQSSTTTTKTVQIKEQQLYNNIQ